MADEPYRKVSLRMWSDEKFVGLSPMKPSAQGLWFYMLTGKRTTAIPGLLTVGVMGLAEDLHWPLAATRKCLDEIVKSGMAVVDPVANLIWLPNAIHHNCPANPSVVIGWKTLWRTLPEVPLRAKASAAMRQALAGEDADRLKEGRPAGLTAAFDVVLGAKALAESGLKIGRPRRSKDVSATSDPEHSVPDGVPHPVGQGVQQGADLQDQDQEQKQELASHAARARGGEALGHGAPLPAPQRDAGEPEPDPAQDPTRWLAAQGFLVAHHDGKSVWSVLVGSKALRWCEEKCANEGHLLLASTAAWILNRGLSIAQSLSVAQGVVDFYEAETRDIEWEPPPRQEFVTKANDILRAIVPAPKDGPLPVPLISLPPGFSTWEDLARHLAPVKPYAADILNRIDAGEQNLFTQGRRKCLVECYEQVARVGTPSAGGSASPASGQRTKVNAHLAPGSNGAFNVENQPQKRA